MSRISLARQIRELEHHFNFDGRKKGTPYSSPDFSLSYSPAMHEPWMLIILNNNILWKHEGFDYQFFGQNPEEALRRLFEYIETNKVEVRQMISW